MHFLFQKLKSLSFIKISFFFTALILIGCTTPLKTTSKSGIDADFKFKKIQSAISIDTPSESVSIYQNVLRGTMYSQCEYFPSDSVYSQSLSKKCGSLISLFKTFGRYIAEPDAAYLGIAIRPTTGKYKFIDLPESCEIF